MKNADQIEMFVELRAHGLSFQKISERLGVSKQTLINWSKSHQVEINNLKQLRKDAMRDRFMAVEEKKVDILVSLLERVRSQMIEVDLSRLTAKDLLDLQERLESQISTSVDPIFEKDEIAPSFPNIEKWQP